MIKTIFSCPAHKQQQTQQDSCIVVANKGIVGDRYFDLQTPPGQNISFIALEEINHYNQHYQQTVSIDQARRNIVTTGVDLNALIDKEFTIGDVRFRGIELCQPCKSLSQELATETMKPQQVIIALINRVGIRATVLSDGELKVGMPFTVAD